MFKKIITFLSAKKQKFFSLGVTAFELPAGVPRANKLQPLQKKITSEKDLPAGVPRHNANGESDSIL